MMQEMGADVTGVSKDEFKKWIQSSKRKTKPFSEYRSVTPIESNGVIGRSLTEQEATDLIDKMENAAEAAHNIELTPENWIAQFGENGQVATPMGIVKLGENQFMKLYNLKRAGYFGMMYPTLNAPDVVIEKNAPSDGAERDTKLLFVKTFVKPDGGRIVHFESITVQRDGMEVSVSSHEAEAKDIKKDMQKEKILHISERLSPSSEWSLTEAPQKAEGPDLVPTSDKISSDINTKSNRSYKERQHSMNLPIHPLNNLSKVAASLLTVKLILYRQINKKLARKVRQLRPKEERSTPSSATKSVIQPSCQALMEQR